MINFFEPRRKKSQINLSYEFEIECSQRSLQSNALCIKVYLLKEGPESLPNVSQDNICKIKIQKCNFMLS